MRCGARFRVWCRLRVAFLIMADVAEISHLRSTRDAGNCRGFPSIFLALCLLLIHRGPAPAIQRQESIYLLILRLPGLTCEPRTRGCFAISSRVRDKSH